jgi:hypothetical protein
MKYDNERDMTMISRPDSLFYEPSITFGLRLRGHKIRIRKTFDQLLQRCTAGFSLPRKADEILAPVREIDDDQEQVATSTTSDRLPATVSPHRAEPDVPSLGRVGVTLIPQRRTPCEHKVLRPIHDLTHHRGDVTRRTR